jgi:hypothetical protein
MNLPPQRRSATRVALSAALLWASFAGFAADAGKVTHASGLLFAHHVSGRTRILAPDSTVQEGETLISGNGAYSQVVLADGTQITLKPEAQLRIDRFSYDAAKPGEDHANLTLVSGTIRMRTGAIAKRGARQTLATPAGNVAIDESTFIAEVMRPAQTASLPTSFAQLSPRHMPQETASDASPDWAPSSGEAPLRLAQAIVPVVPTLGAKAPGLYVTVLDGIIHLSNSGGSSSFAAGQFGYTASFRQAPVVLPNNPGIQFTPPPQFSQNSGVSSTTGPARSNSVDCEVR